MTVAGRNERGRRREREALRDGIGGFGDDGGNWARRKLLSESIQGTLAPIGVHLLCQIEIEMVSFKTLRSVC